MRKTILLIDDNCDLNIIVAAHLRDEGFEVKSVCDGETALTLLKQQSYDFVIIDYRLPGKNGVEVIKSIDKLDPEIKIIFISAEFVDDLQNIAVSSGASFCLDKPFSLIALTDFLRNKS